MYVIIRRFAHLHSVAEATRRAESGMGQLMKQSPGFQGYYIFDAGDGTGGSVTFFETRDDALAANEKALAWIHASLADLMDSEPEVTIGDVLAVVRP
jgi:hypothetical protein